MRLPACAAGAGAGARRQGRGGFSASAARLPGQRDGVLVERAGRLDHAARLDRAVLADDPERLCPPAPAPGDVRPMRRSAERRRGPQAWILWDCVAPVIWNTVYQSPTG